MGQHQRPTFVPQTQAMTKTYPKLNIRVSAELKAACDAAGAERVRELLSVLVAGQPPAVPVKARVVRQKPVSAELSHKEEPKRSWKDAIAANEAKVAAQKAEADRVRREREANKRLLS